MIITVEGFPQLERKLEKLHGLARWAAINVIAETALKIENTAKRNWGKVGEKGSPRNDTGVTRASLTTMFTSDRLTAEVGSNNENARRMERGTGIFNLDHDGKTFFPPPQELVGWCQRHGIPTDPGTLFLIARSISEKGGMPSTQLLEHAADEQKEEYVKRMAVVMNRGIDEIRRMT